MTQILWLPFLCTGATLTAVWPWTALYDRRPALRCLTAAVATSGWIVGICCFLSALGWLNRTMLLLATAGFTTTLLALWWTTPLRRHARPLELRRPTRLGLLLGTLTAVLYTALLLAGWLVPPYGWDTLVYHLTVIFQAAQTGSLTPFPFPAAQFYFPQVGELHSLWFFLLAGSGEHAWRLTGIALIPFALTAGLAMRIAAEALELKRALPWILPATMLTPLMLIQPLAGYVDAAFTAFLLAGFAFALLAAVHRRGSDFAFCALSCGLAMGTKISFLYFCLPIVVVLASWPVLRSLVSRSALYRVPLWIALFLLGCGYWLVPHATKTGNPLYPIAVKVGSTTLLPGPVSTENVASERQRYLDDGDSGWGWWTYPFNEKLRSKTQYSPENGFGPLFAAGFVALPFALWIAVRDKRWLLARALLALPATLLAWAILSPWEHPRYALPACGFALLALAVITARVPRLTVSGALLHLALVAGITFSGVAGLLAATPDLPRALSLTKKGQSSPATFYHYRYGPYGHAFSWLSAAERSGSTVTFTSPYFIAPLYGWHGRNRVVYRPNPSDPSLAGQTLLLDYRDWRKFLHQEEVEYVVVWKHWQDGQKPRRISERWLVENLSDFRLVQQYSDTVQIYEPIFRSEELATLYQPRSPIDLERLSQPENWRAEYVQGGTVAIGEAGERLRISYDFNTPQNDYLDLRAETYWGRWPEFGNLNFDLAGASDSVLLFVYLKEHNARRMCRYQVKLNGSKPSSQSISLNLQQPDWQTDGFDVTRVTEMHLVLEDALDEDTLTSEISISNFHLQQPQSGA